MAVAQFATLNVPVSVAAGTAFECEDLVEKHVAVFGTFSATLQIQIANDAVPTWVNVGAAITAPGITEVTVVAKKIRINVTAFVSGVPNAILSGRNDRTS